MRYLVGYTADRGGRRALRLAGALAADPPAEVVIAQVEPAQNPFTAVYPGADTRGYGEILDATLHRWGHAALTELPDTVSGRLITRAADTEAEGILAAATETGADLIVVAPRDSALPGTLGQVARGVLDASPVPVLLAVEQVTEPVAPQRVSAFIGTRPGGAEVARTAALIARRRGIPLRIVSMLEVDRRTGAPAQQIDRAREQIEQITREHTDAAVEIAHGRSSDEAFARVAWRPSDLAVVGARRFDQRTRLRLGTVAHRIVRQSPVPVLVVPPPEPAKGEKP